MQAHHFFAKSGVWPIDVVHHFITHIDQTLWEGVMENGLVHNTTAISKDPYNQILFIQKEFAASLVCEKQNQKNHNIAKSTIK